MRKEKVCVCLSAIDDGELNYEPGDEFEGSDEARRTLLASGAVELRDKSEFE